MNRKRHKWNVSLQREDGEIVQHEINNYWDPEAEGTAERIGVTAAAEAHYDHGRKQFKFFPTGVKYLGTA